MELSKNKSNMLKGIAILFMVMLHLFARKEVNGLYETFPMIKDVPLVYYFALFGDACVPIYLFLSGYGLFTIFNKVDRTNNVKNLKRILKLLINFWIILILFVALGFLLGYGDKFPGSIEKFLLNFFLLSNSYNGAWWFLQTYTILIILSPLLISAVNKIRPINILVIIGVIYLLSYILFMIL